MNREVIRIEQEGNKPVDAYTPTPIFEKGNVPVLYACEIQDRKYDNGQWKYFICNRYSAYGSGWIYEDDLIERISKEQKRTKATSTVESINQ